MADEVTESMAEPTKELKLSPTELDGLKEMLSEANKLQAMNAQLDLQKHQVLQELNNNIVSYQKFVAKVQKKYNIPQTANVNMNVDTGVITVNL
jgi:hypothetical protein